MAAKDLHTRRLMELKSELLHTLEERGFIYQATDIEALDALCAHQSITGYIGFDATAKSLQVGNLSAIMTLRWMQKFGHRPLVLVGGGTSRIGDPSFRQTARPLLTLEQVQANIDGISKVFSRLLDFGPGKALLLNNADWLSSLGYIDFLRDYGKHFTVNRMLSFDSVKTRLDKNEPLSFLEFNYMLLQAYDFYYLNKTYGCVLQAGGSDQWGNIVNGVELTRKLSNAAGQEGFAAYGLTSPLVTNASGTKLGKTVAGAIWLNGDMLAPYEYWQFWRNTDDRDVVRYLKRFTDLPMEEIARLAELKDQEINIAKAVLADEATAMIHGRDVLDGIHAAAQAVFGAGGEDATLPSFEIQVDQLPIALDDLFVLSGLCASKGEFKRLLAGDGVRFQNDLIHDPKQKLEAEAFQDGGLLLAVGKKKHLKVVLR